MPFLPQGAKFLHPNTRHLLRQSQPLCQRPHEEHRAPHTRAHQRSSQPSSSPLAAVNSRGRLCPSAPCVLQQGCPDEHALLLPSSSHLQALFHQCRWISTGEGQPGDFGVDKCCPGWPTLLCALIGMGTSPPLSLPPMSSQMVHV